MQSSCLWNGLILHLKSSVAVKPRRLHLKSHSDCFLGSEAVDVLEEYLKGAKAPWGRCDAGPGPGVSLLTNQKYFLTQQTMVWVKP